MILFHCPHCGLDFASNAISGTLGARVYVENAAINCPECGGTAKSYDGFYEWFETAEATIRQAGISKKQAKRIQRKILTAKDLHALPTSIETIDKSVARAVRLALEETKTNPEADRWQWLYRIGAVVGIVAGVNTFFEDYNLDAALKWVLSKHAQQSQYEASEVPQDEAMPHPPKSRNKGPR